MVRRLSVRRPSEDTHHEVTMLRKPRIYPGLGRVMASRSNARADGEAAMAAMRSCRVEGTREGTG